MNTELEKKIFPYSETELIAAMPEYPAHIELLVEPLDSEFGATELGHPVA
jgi:hypothetical protein